MEEANLPKLPDHVTRELSRLYFVGFYFGKNFYEKYKALLRAKKLENKYGICDKGVEEEIKRLREDYLLSRVDELKKGLIGCIFEKNENQADLIKRKLLKTRAKIEELVDSSYFSDADRTGGIETRELGFSYGEILREKDEEECYNVLMFSSTYKEFINEFYRYLLSYTCSRFIKKAEILIDRIYIYKEVGFTLDLINSNKELKKVVNRLKKLDELFCDSSLEKTNLRKKVDDIYSKFINNNTRKLEELQRCIANLPEKH